MTTFKGGCCCGAVRYEITGDPVVTMQCQCRACQKDTGTGHSSILVFPKTAARFTGRTTEFERPGDSGGRVTKSFCPTCGGTVKETLTVLPDVVVIHVGSLDDPSVYTPQMVVYTSRALSWDQIDPTLPKFPQMPPM
jgi:hypothetical protein